MSNSKTLDRIAAVAVTTCLVLQLFYMGVLITTIAITGDVRPLTVNEIHNIHQKQCELLKTFRANSVACLLSRDGK